MAFNVIFYNFAKKDNSTAVPASGGTTYSCTLKDGCSITSPVIKLNLGPTSGDPIAYNYCYISNFNRYYFVSDWTSDKGMWYGSLNVDVLASFKTAIGNASEMIVRAASEYDGRIIDTMYPTMNEQSFASYSASLNPWWDETTGGIYIIGLLSYLAGSSMQGGVNYLALNPARMDTFMDLVFDVGPIDPNAPAVMDNTILAVRNVFTGISEQHARALAYLAENPYTDYIDSITWVPVTSTENAYNGFYLGPNYVDCMWQEVDIKSMYNFTWQLTTVPKHPQSATRGSYLNMGPYSEYSLFLPRAGTVDIDPVLLADYSVLTVELDIDPVTGQGLYRIYVGDGAYVKHMVQQIFVPIGVTVKIGRNKPVGQMATMFAGAVQAGFNTVAAAAQGQLNLGVVGAVANVVRESKAPAQGTIGDAGGYNGLFPGYPALQAHFMYVTDEDQAENGRPLMRIRTINTLSGYVKCQHGDIQVACTDTERASIRGFLEGGFFYE